MFALQSSRPKFWHLSSLEILLSPNFSVQDIVRVLVNLSKKRAYVENLLVGGVRIQITNSLIMA